jgi:hypothetical protein
MGSHFIFERKNNSIAFQRFRLFLKPFFRHWKAHFRHYTPPCVKYQQRQFWYANKRRKSQHMCRIGVSATLTYTVVNIQTKARAEHQVPEHNWLSGATNFHFSVCCKKNKLHLHREDYPQVSGIILPFTITHNKNHKRIK